MTLQDILLHHAKRNLPSIINNLLKPNPLVKHIRRMSAIQKIKQQSFFGEYK